MSLIRAKPKVEKTRRHMIGWRGASGSDGNYVVERATRLPLRHIGFTRSGDEWVAAASVT